MATILQDLEQLGQYFALHTRTTQDMCLQFYHWDPCNNEGARARTKIRAHSLDPAASML